MRYTPYFFRRNRDLPKTPKPRFQMNVYQILRIPYIKAQKIRVSINVPVTNFSIAGLYSATEKALNYPCPAFSPSLNMSSSTSYSEKP